MNGAHERYPYRDSAGYMIWGSLTKEETIKLYVKHFMIENKGQLHPDTAKKMALEFIETNKMYGGIASDGHGGISMELYHECHDRGCF
jgi:hypothetical protein